MAVHDDPKSNPAKADPCELSELSCLVTTNLSDMQAIARTRLTTSDLHQVHLDEQDSHLDAARSSLKRASKGILADDDFTRLTANLEKQSAANGLSADQIAGTYRQLDRLLSSQTNTPVSAQNRQLLAEEFMTHMGEAAPALSGHADTCTWGFLQYRMMTREPEIAAKMLADVATTGSVTLPNGRKIHIDTESLQPDHLAQSNNVGMNRDYFGQVVQVAMISSKYATETMDPAGQKVPIGTLHFLQIPDTQDGDLGERVYSEKKGKRTVFGSAIDQVGGGGYFEDVQKVEALWNGKNVLPFTLYGSDAPWHGEIQPTTPQKLKEALEAERDAGNFPVGIAADASKSPVSEIYLQRNPEQKAAPAYPHTLGVTNIQEVDGKTMVTLYNPWGYLSTVPIDVLFEAMKEPK